MSHSHNHNVKHLELDWIDSKKYQRVLNRSTWLLTIIALTFSAAIFALWPSDWTSQYSRAPIGFVENTNFYQGTVSALSLFECSGYNGLPPDSSGQFSKSQCAHIKVTLNNGPLANKVVELDVEPKVLSYGLAVSDSVTLAEFPGQDGEPAFVFQDFNRQTHLLIFVALFVIIVLAIARMQGLRALLGLVVGFVLALGFVVPSLAIGQNVVLILVLAIPVMTIGMLFLGHGHSLKTVGAILGTLFGSVLALAGSIAAVNYLKLTGFTSEDDALLSAVASSVKLSNLLIASIVIAGLGALNDVTVTQSSAVWELGEGQVKHGNKWAFVKSMRIGRDHISSSIYTITFAYVGSALVTIMLLMLSKTSMSFVFNSELIVQEIALICIGLISLILSTPITTAVSIWLVNASQKTPLTDSLIDTDSH